MSNFTSDLQLQPLASGKWRTARAMTFGVGKLGSNWAVVVPRGFETDLGSIPAFIRWLLNPADASCAQPFVLHDFLCKDPALSRVLIDAILWDAMVAVDVAPWKRNVIYFGVSFFRWWRWLRPAP